MSTRWEKFKSVFKEQATTTNKSSPVDVNAMSMWSGGSLWGTGFSTVETNETVFSIVTRLANTVSALPLDLIDNTGESVWDSSIASLATERANPNMTAFELWNKVETDRNTTGNGYVYIERDDLYQPKYLWPVKPELVTPMINSMDDTLWYRFQGGMGISTDKFLLVPASSVIHVKHITGTSHIKGISPLDVLKGALDYDSQVLKFQLSDMTKRDSFTIQYDTNVDEKKRKAAVDNVRSFIKENGGVLFSERGVTVDTIDRKLASQDVADYDSISRRRIANAFNIPITFLNETSDSGYKSSEQMMIQFVQMTLTPIIAQYEQQLNDKLLTSRQRIEYYHWRFNVNGLLRGDTSARKDFYQTGIRNGFMTPNEIREMEGLKPSKDKNADKLFISGDLYPIDMDPEKRKGTATGAVGSVDRNHDSIIGAHPNDDNKSTEGGDNDE